MALPKVLTAYPKKRGVIVQTGWQPFYDGDALIASFVQLTAYEPPTAGSAIDLDVKRWTYYGKNTARGLQRLIAEHPGTVDSYCTRLVRFDREGWLERGERVETTRWLSYDYGRLRVRGKMRRVPMSIRFSHRAHAVNRVVGPPAINVDELIAHARGAQATRFANTLVDFLAESDAFAPWFDRPGWLPKNVAAMEERVKQREAEAKAKASPGLTGMVEEMADEQTADEVADTAPDTGEERWR